MKTQPKVSECISIAIQALKIHEIPAVVFYDNHSDAIIAEAASRFIMRPDFSSDRYQILLRVEEGYIYALELIRRKLERSNHAHIVDITAKHFGPRGEVPHSSVP